MTSIHSKKGSQCFPAFVSAFVLLLAILISLLISIVSSGHKRHPRYHVMDTLYHVIQYFSLGQQEAGHRRHVTVQVSYSLHTDSHQPLSLGKYRLVQPAFSDMVCQVICPLCNPVGLTCLLVCGISLTSDHLLKSSF